MKLLLCTKCNEIFNLSHTLKTCTGGHGGGLYTDNLNAKIFGSPDEIFILGFSNPSLSAALHAQKNFGDLKDKLNTRLGRTGQVKGREFTAFIIPDETSTVERLQSMNEI